MRLTCLSLSRISAPTCQNIGSKVLKGRPGTVKKALDVMLAFIEWEQVDEVLVSSPEMMPYCPRSVNFSTRVALLMVSEGQADPTPNRLSPKLCCTAR